MPCLAPLASPRRHALLAALCALAAARGCHCDGDDAPTPPPADGAVSDAAQETPGPCTIRFDSNNDGTADSITTLVYDDEGRLIRREEDSDGDGAVDSVTSWTYDDRSGNMLTEESDLDADGVIDQITRFARDVIPRCEHA